MAIEYDMQANVTFLSATNTSANVAASATTATNAAMTASANGFDGFININPATIVCTLLNTLIMFLILRHFLFARVNKMLESRQEQVDSVYKDADKAKLQAESIKTEYSAKMDSARAESTEIINTAKARARTKSDEIVFAAKEQATQLMSKAGSDIERERSRVMNQMKDEISDIAMAVAEKVVERELQQQDNEQFIKEAISSLDGKM